MELTTVGAALELLAKASKALDSLRERAKTSHDVALKESISNLYDDFLDLKAIIVRLTEENAALRRAQSEKPPKPEIRQVGDTNYYYVGDAGPHCQPCYDKNGKLVLLTARQEYMGGMGRVCQVCKDVFIEGPGTPRPQRQVGRYGY